AAEHLHRAATLAAGVPDATLEGRVHLSLAALYDQLAQPEPQIAALDRAAECFAGGDAVYLQAVALTELSRAQAGRGDRTAARAAQERVTRLYADMSLPDEDRVH